MFYDGRLNKIGPVRLENEPTDENFMEPWHFVSADGRFDLTLVPEKRHTSGLMVADLAGHESRQVYGRAGGFAVLDDGTRIEIKDMFTFAEKVRNAW